MTLERQNDLLTHSPCHSQEPWQYLEKAACYRKLPPLISPRSYCSNSAQVNRSLFTVTIPQRTKVLYISPPEPCKILAWVDLIGLFSKDHSGFSVSLNPLDYNHKRKDSDALCWPQRKAWTRQKVFPTAILSYNDCAFYFSQERVI